jgi:hypothetical protein
MNGRPRDHFLTDILNHRIPTYSETADSLIEQIKALSGRAEEDELQEAVSAWQRGVAMDSWALWMNPPWRYLGEWEQEQVTALEGLLAHLLERRRSAARERGWETD